MIIEIPGRPVAKQRARTVNGHTYTPPKTRAFEEMVAMCVLTQRNGATVAGDVNVTITMGGTTRLRGDIDNYAKAILDGVVKGGAIEDDRQVRGLYIEAHEGMDEWVTFVEICSRV